MRVSGTGAIGLPQQKESLLFEQEGLRYRAIGSEDLETIRCWRNAEDTRSQFVFTGLLTPQNQVDWYGKYRVDSTDIMFLVEAADESGKDAALANLTQASPIPAGWVPVGCAALYHLDADKGEAEFGRLMIGNPAFRGKGLGRRITEALTAYGLSKLGLNRIYLEVYQDNPAALRSYLAAGFTLMPEERTVNGRILVKLERKKHNA